MKKPNTKTTATEINTAGLAAVKGGSFSIADFRHLSLNIASPSQPRPREVRFLSGKFGRVG